jgi:hypothetical protein
MHHQEHEIMLTHAVELDLRPAALGDKHTLACPHCHESFLHHFGVDIYEAEMEGVRPGLHVHTHKRVLGREETGELSLEVKQPASAPGRYSTVRVRFYCETCNAKPLMELRQSKGQTFITWEEL